MRSFKVVLSNAEEFTSYNNKVVEGIDIIYHGTSQIPCTLKEELAVRVTGTWKVQVIQHSIGTNKIKLSFYAYTGATDPFIVKSYTASSVSEDSNTMDSKAAVATTLVSEGVAVDSDPNTESFQIGCWYAVYFKPYDYWFAGFAIDILNDELVKMDFLQQLGQNVNWFGAKEEIEGVSHSDIFFKLADELVPVSSTRTNQLRLSDGDFDMINELFSSGLF